MRRGWKIVVAAILVLAVLLGLNALTAGQQTKAAEVTVDGGRILKLDGADLQVLERGPRDGSPIVLIHGFTCAIDWWDRVMPILARKHRVVAVDLLGHGGSEKSGSGYSMSNQADLVAQALSRLGIRDATVVGHSLGGTVATALASQSPNLVGRLVILDQAPNGDYGEGLPFTAELTMQPVLGPALWRFSPDFMVEDGLGNAFAPGHEVPDEFIEDFRRMTYTSYDHTASAEDEYTGEMALDQRVRELGVPLLAIFGSEEQIYEPQKALDAYAAIPGARTALITGAGHSPHVEQPAKTAALVLGFAEARKPPKNASPRHGSQKSMQDRQGVRTRP